MSSFVRSWQAGTVIVMLLSATLACGPFRAPRTPLETITYEAATATPKRLLVLLPGRGSRAADFRSKGFIETARQIDPELDVIAVGAHLGYYRSKTLPDRLWQDVVQPRQSRGYEEIWIAGTSLGGLGAVAFSERYGEAVTGIILLSPYLGPNELLDEIEGARSLGEWVPSDSDDDFQRFWIWLQGYPRDEIRPRIILAYGADDRLERAHRLLAAALPEDRVIRVEGGHGWRVWRTLWRDVLTRALQQPE